MLELLLAPARPNLIPTQDISSSAWTATGATTPAFDTFMETAATSNHGMASPASAIRPIPATYIAEGDFKAIGAAQYLDIGAYTSGFGNGANTTFDLVGGSVVGSGQYGGLTLSSARVTSPGGGIFHCWQKIVTSGAETTLLMDYQIKNPFDTYSFAGNTSDGFRMWNLRLYRA